MILLTLRVVNITIMCKQIIYLFGKKIEKESNYLVITMYSSHVLLTITLLLLYFGAQNFIHYTEDHVNEYRIKKNKDNMLDSRITYTMGGT